MSATASPAPIFSQTHLRLVWRLMRANMTVISAVTHLAAAILSTSAAIPPTERQFSLILFFRSWAFVLCTQFATHMLGEVHDFESDRLNKYATPITGGSRVLQEGTVTIRLALRLAALFVTLSALLAAFVVPVSARPFAFFMLLLAVAYTTPPVALNYRGLGELEAAVITSILVPHFSAVSQGAAPALTLLHAPLALLVIPPFLTKIALFLVLNMADRRSDWAAGKVTLAVKLGDRRSAQLHAGLLVATYISAFFVIVCRALSLPSSLGWYYTLAVAFLIAPARLATRLARDLLQRVPYRLDSYLPPTMFHSTLLVWSILAHALCISLPFHGWMQSYVPLIVVFASITVRNYLRPPPRPKMRDDDDEETVSNDVEAQLHHNSSTLADSRRIHPPLANTNGADIVRADSDVASGTPVIDTVSADANNLSYDVIIVGSGVAGLVSALTLDSLGLRVMVFERHLRSDASTGADVALWPGAITILRRLGVQNRLFESDCFPLRKVHMCTMRFENEEEEGRPTAEVLKTIDMTAVTEGTGEHFVLVSRQKLMDALLDIVPSGVIVYDADVARVDNKADPEDSVAVSYDAEGVRYNATARVVIGADGARSLVRRTAVLAGRNPDSGDEDNGIRFCGEACYRGVLHATTDSTFPHAVQRALLDIPSDATMRINYGAGLRSSFGYMSTDGDTVYWWVKEQMAEMPSYRGKLRRCTWPSPLRELHDATPEDAFYMHPIEDSADLPRWSNGHCVLVGDAAHLVTPNMGQGACMAVEDAFVLSVFLKKFWTWPDGHVEAFYSYESSRRPFAQAVAAESRKQLFIGQLSSPWTVWLRESFLRIVPASILQNSLRRHNFPVREHIDLFDSLSAQT